MAQSKRTNLRTILPLIKTRLVAQSVLDTDRIHWTIENFVPKLVSTRDILLVPTTEISDRELFAGGGSRTRRCTRTLEVIVRTQFAGDPAGRSLHWLTDATYGHSQLEDQIIDSFDDHVIVDSDNNELFVQPMEYLNTRLKPREQRPWGESTLTFEFIYRRDTTLPGG